MNLGETFRNFQLGKIKLGPRWLNLEIDFKPGDQDAAWELYVEMLARIVTQPLPADAISKAPNWQTWKANPK